MLSVPTGFAAIAAETETRRGEPRQPQEEVQGKRAFVAI